MSEAVNALCKYCFRVLNSQVIESHCATTNQRSLALIKKLGFEDEKVLEKYEDGSDGFRRDCMLFLLRDPAKLPALSLAW